MHRVHLAAALAASVLLASCSGGGSGKQSEVKCVQCGTLATVRDFTAFDPSFLGGVFVG